MVSWPQGLRCVAATLRIAPLPPDDEAIEPIQARFHRSAEQSAIYIPAAQRLWDYVAVPAPVHGRANRSGWDFRVFQKRGRQNLVYENERVCGQVSYET